MGTNKRTAIVIGAGIAGLAMARALALMGYQVKVIERNHTAVGASVRNFGMVWPVGQPSGELYNAALRSAEIWKDECSKAGIFFDPVGSLHLAYENDEAEVLEELYESYNAERPLKLLEPDSIKLATDAVVEKGLISGLYSSDEVIVDPREAIGKLPQHFHNRYDIEFVWNQAVIRVETGAVYTFEKEYRGDVVIVCSGVEFETLFPDIFREHSAVKCKLQMLRFGSQPEGWRIGPALCGGLSLIHYHSFRVADSLEKLRNRFELEFPEHLKWGIHVMVSQNGKGELTVGDSHEYGGTHDPFDRSFINELILQYLSRFAKFRRNEVAETWNGVYTKLTNGDPYFFKSPCSGVYVFNGLGGAGMTLSFGIAEKLLKSI